MEWTHETFGTTTFLVNTLAPEDRIDNTVLGMLTNNRIEGFVPVLFSQADDLRLLKYNVTAKTPASIVFNGVVNKKRILGLCSSVAGAMDAAEEYMIDAGSLLIDMEYIFFDVGANTAALICLPVAGARSDVDGKDFFKSLLINSRFDSNENGDYIIRLINCLNTAGGHWLPEFSRLVAELSNESQRPAQAPPGRQAGPAAGRAPGPAVQAQPQVQPQHGQQPSPGQAQPQPWPQQGQRPAQGQPPAPPPVSPPQPQPGQRNPHTVQLLENQPDAGFRIPPGRGGQGQAGPQPGSGGAFGIPPAPGRAGSQPSSQPAPLAQAEEEEEISLFYLLQHYNSDNKAKYDAQKRRKKEGSGKAPQQPAPSLQGQSGWQSQPGQQAQPGQPGPESIPEEERITLYYLLQHYNAQNKAMYDRYKKLKKAQGKTKPPKQGKKGKGKEKPEEQYKAPGFAMPGQPGQQIQQPQPGQYGQAGQQPSPVPAPSSLQPQPAPQPGQYGQPGQQIQQPQPGPAPERGGQFAQQPSPQQGMQQPFGGRRLDFGDTVDLSHEFNDEHTVELNPEQASGQWNPYLVRKSNGEKIQIDKSVFSIGRERGFVDYVVTGNRFIGHVHCHFVSRDGEYYIVDDNSKNHTFVNNQMIQASTEVKIAHGTAVRLGDEEFEFKLY